MRMYPSAKCLNLIKKYEQCRLKAYMPTPNDRPTIGWGSTGKDIKLGMEWTQKQADDRFRADLVFFAAGVNRLLVHSQVPTSQNQFDALVSFAYNVGLDEDEDMIAEGLGDSTLLRKHLRGDFAGAAAEFPKWNKQNGKVLRGLTRRREDEAKLYRGES